MLSSGRKNKYSKKGEKELLLLFRKTGYEQYFAEFFCRFTYPLLGVCLRYLHDADESVSAVMKIYEISGESARKSEIKSPRAWLYKHAIEHCFNVVSMKEGPVTGEFPDKGDIKSAYMKVQDYLDMISPEGSAKREEIFNSIKNSLNDDEKILFEDVLIKEKEFTEINKIRGFSLSEIKDLLRRAKKKIYLKLEFLEERKMAGRNK